MPDTRITSASAFDQRPAWVSAINTAWRGTYFLGTKIRLDKDDLIRRARRQTGLQDFGPDFWEEPLDRLLYAVEHEADLHPFGRFITRERFTNLLAIRLRAERDFRKDPSILDRELYPVWLICGLQRTGTTKLQRLLGADPDNRVLLSWEALNPVPLGDGPSETDKRIKAARLSEKALKLLAPGFFSIHPVEHEKPEEDILLLDTTFLSTTPEATMHVPSYAAWLEQTDQSPAYAYAVKLLKYLQVQRPGKRWVLKSPHHLEFLDLAQRYFGDVHFIWTHRDLGESLPSFLSMVAHSRAIFSDNVTAEQVARHWVRKTGYMLSQGIAFRQQHPEARFTDIDYRSFVTDPMPVIEHIYGPESSVSPAMRERFEEVDRRNGPRRFGTHVYSLGDFGLDREAVDLAGSVYIDFMRNHK